MNILRKVAVFPCLLVLALSVRAQELRVAAAADLQFAMKDLAGQYEKRTGTKVAVSYGSSGNFSEQIQNGAPFDLFFSADVIYAQRLVSAGLADPQSFFVYAQGHLVLWAPADANLHLAERGFEALKDARVQKIAIANPEHAPYGRAAVARNRSAAFKSLRRETSITATAPESQRSQRLKRLSATTTFMRGWAQH
jgi:molybdate transport system substrate-binding protein